MSVGDAVLDGYKQTASWSDNGIEWLSDVVDFYRERAAIEREAAAKLASLTSKHFTKKANVTAAVSVGDKPSTTPGSLENMTMESWMETSNQTELISQERRKLADEMVSHVSDELVQLKTRFEDSARTYKRFDEQLEEQREKTNSHVKRAKHQYDQACESMESARAKSKKSIEPKEQEMYKCKNSYSVQINIANRMKDKHFHDDSPESLDSMQRANEARVAQTNRSIMSAGSFEKKRLTNSIACLDTSLSALTKNDPKLDSNMFIEHNANVYQWADPPDFSFEPSPIWHDNDEMYTKSEEAVKHSSASLGDANNQSVTSSSESQRALATYEEAKAGVDKAEFSELTPAQTAPSSRSEAANLQKLVEAETKRLAVEVEIEAIEVATASIDMSHVPQTRIKKHRTIFGKKKEVVEVVNSSSAASGHSNRALGSSSSLARTKIGSQHGRNASGGGTQASIKYDFQAAGPGELSVSAGDVLELSQGDDGSGWVKLAGIQGEGLVPASYVEISFGGMQPGQTSAAPPAPSGGPPASPAKPAPPPTRGSQEKKMIALYNYDAADPSQSTIAPNDVITVVEADQGSGWTTGVINGQQGIFPTAYARPA